MSVLPSFGVVAIAVGVVVFSRLGPDDMPQNGPDGGLLQPNWSAISLWPGRDGEAATQPDPDRLTTVIVLDDSGSMENDIMAAKIAVAEAVNQLPENGRVAITALNSGVLMPPTPVSQARGQMARAVLGPVRADGGTPLGAALAQAHDIIKGQAAAQRGFGTYRIILTTDGNASDDIRLEQEVKTVL